MEGNGRRAGAANSGAAISNPTTSPNTTPTSKFHNSMKIAPKVTKNIAFDSPWSREQEKNAKKTKRSTHDETRTRNFQIYLFVKVWHANQLRHPGSRLIGRSESKFGTKFLPFEVSRAFLLSFTVIFSRHINIVISNTTVFFKCQKTDRKYLRDCGICYFFLVYCCPDLCRQKPRRRLQSEGWYVGWFDWTRIPNPCILIIWYVTSICSASFRFERHFESSRGGQIRKRIRSINRACHESLRYTTYTYTHQNLDPSTPMYQVQSPCRVEDGKYIAQSKVAAFWDESWWRLSWTGRTKDYVLRGITDRSPKNLLTDREVRRHQKAVHSETGDIVGYARWIMPESHKDSWLIAQTPDVNDEEREMYTKRHSEAEFDPRSEHDELDDHMDGWREKYKHANCMGKR